MSFRAALDRALATLLAPAPAEVRTAFRPWIDLLERLGPTPRSGPLHHDLLWPSDAVGLNAFDHGPGLVMPVARAFTFDILGNEAAAELADLERRVPATTRFHVGATHDRERGWRLKLWAFGPRTDAIAVAFGAQPGDWTHLGIDLRDGGLERARGYRRATPSDAWDRSVAWLESPHDAGVSHRIVAELGRWDEPDAKRSFDTIFGPEATVDDLFAEQQRVAALDVPPAPSAELVRALAGSVAGHGVVLRPAAYEIDVHPGEPPRPDLLLTLGETSAPQRFQIRQR